MEQVFDFLMVDYFCPRKDVMVLRPNFNTIYREDIMTKGGDFYAAFLRDENRWTTNEAEVCMYIDKYMRKAYEEFMASPRSDNYTVRVEYMWDSRSGAIDAWHKYVKGQLRDKFEMLDQIFMFNNTVRTRKSYSTKTLPYPLIDYSPDKSLYEAWDKLVGTICDKDGRLAIEWAIGLCLTGDAKKVQKFLVFFGAPGTGKSTIFRILDKIFEGYTKTYDGKALGNSNDQFSTEIFADGPLIGIQDDGDLSKLEDNTKLNSIVSHEKIIINPKGKSRYAMSFNTFLFMGTNSVVRITDSKSGLMRRLIDIHPTGDTIPFNEYLKLTKQVEFEIPYIAKHCIEVYEQNKHAFDNYKPLRMLGASNEFFNFVVEQYEKWEKDDATTLNAAWLAYEAHCTNANVRYKMSKTTSFKEELKSYFREFKERANDVKGRPWNYYSGFKKEAILDIEPGAVKEEDTSETYIIDLKYQPSLLDRELADYPAQYANEKGTPSMGWDYVKTTVKDIDTSKTHYILGPEQLIFLDFDLKEAGQKSLAKNLLAASSFPKTYSELSNGGNGLHLYYWYDGDPLKLESEYGKEIEIKVRKGKSPIRRRVIKCNNLPIAHISTGLPLRKEKIKVYNKKAVSSEIRLRSLITRAMNKEFEPHHTGPAIDFINTLLDQAYESGLLYDIRDMEGDIKVFAMSSSNQWERCLKVANAMKYCCSEAELYSAHLDDVVGNNDTDRLVFIDIEALPDIFGICWKFDGDDYPVNKLINPAPEHIRPLYNFRLCAHNGLNYDGPMLYAAGELGANTAEERYLWSQRIISGDRSASPWNGKNLIWCDTYDAASAGNKMSLKKWEIELDDAAHLELGLPWDQPVGEENFERVMEYCANDVLSLEQVFHSKAFQSDWAARLILADVTNMPVNTTTNNLTKKLVLGGAKNPQREYQYRHLGKPVKELPEAVLEFLKERFPEMMAPDAWKKRGESEFSLLPYFEGYTHENGKSRYKCTNPKEGGYVHTEMLREAFLKFLKESGTARKAAAKMKDYRGGVYFNVALLDIASMHPHSILAECLLGPVFTKILDELVSGRLCIKHEDWDTINNFLGGALSPWIDKIKSGEISGKALSNALKTAINSLYGLTSAGFDNEFKDPRNIDNIVAKRGALFMIKLKEEVRKRGFTVAHIKTDSIKIPDATPEIIKFVYDFGKLYGYTFEHEATYEKMALVNKSEYVCKYATEEKCRELYGDEYVDIPENCAVNKYKGGKWDSTGKKFAIPYVFKTLFTHEEVTLKDLYETFNVSKGIIYIDGNENLPDVESYEKELAKLERSYKKGNVSDMTFEAESKRLNMKIDEGHSLSFIGRIGQFLPIRPGFGGGVLYRVNGETRAAVNGTKGYRWAEAAKIKENMKDVYVDFDYYENKVKECIEAIELRGGKGCFSSFAS